MKHDTRNLRHIVRGLLLCAVIALSGMSVFAQEGKPRTGGGRDPFVPYRPVVKVKAVKPSAMPVAPPPVRVRIDNYKAQKLAAMNAQKPAPKPTTALLLDEVQVIGIFRTPRGYAAMVEASPIKLSYVVYPGEQFYNGQLVAIEETRLVFRREIRFSDGRREMMVETKQLRVADAVTNSMTAARQSNNGGGGAQAPAEAVAPASAPDKQ